MTRSTVIVERVPLEYRPTDTPPLFPPMPVLYLEFLENKDKVRAELRDKPSAPIFIGGGPQASSASSASVVPTTLSTREVMNNPVLNIASVDQNLEFYRDHPRDPTPKKNFPSPESQIRSALHDRLKSGTSSRKKEVSDNVQDRHSIKERLLEEERDREKSKQQKSDRAQRLAREQEHAQNQANDREIRRKEDERESRRYRDTHAEREPKDDHREQRDTRDSKREEDRGIKSRWDEPEPVRARSPAKSQPPTVTLPQQAPKKEDPSTQEIRSMLSGEPKKESSLPPPPPPPPPPSAQPQPSTSSLPPTLSELGAGKVHVKGKELHDISYTVQDDIEKKRTLLLRFDILRKANKGVMIPEYNEFTDIRTLERTYEDTVQRLALDDSVDKYTRWLNMGFMGIEVLFTSLLKIDMSGFAKQQMASMSSYQKLLIELGERTMVERTKSNFPTEVRLLFTIVMNAVMFLLTKAVMNGGLGSLLGGGGGGGGGNPLGGLMAGLMGAMGGGGGGGGDGSNPLGGLMSGLAGAMGGGGGGVQGGVPQAQQEVPQASGKKMRGPRINVDEIGKKDN